MFKFLLVLFSAVVLACIAFNVIDGVDTFRWEAGALAAFVASFLPFPDIAIPVTKEPK